MELRLQELEDSVVRENFERVRDEIEAAPILRGKWRFVEITFLAAVTNFLYPHSFGFLAKDVIQTSLTGAGSLTWNYSSFTKDALSITTTGACTVRAFIGTYFEKGSR